MKNTIIKFDTETVDDYIVSDYFSKDINIVDIKDKMIDMLDVYQINNNDKLERVSHELYGTTDYWDILLMINERDPLFDFPYDYDNVYNSTQAFIDIYRFYIYSQAPLVSQAGTELSDEFLEASQEENENVRFILVVKPSRISDFIKLANDNSYI